MPGFAHGEHDLRLPGSFGGEFQLPHLGGAEKELEAAAANALAPPPVAPSAAPSMATVEHLAKVADQPLDFSGDGANASKKRPREDENDQAIEKDAGNRVVASVPAAATRVVAAAAAGPQ